MRSPFLSTIPYKETVEMRSLSFLAVATLVGVLACATEPTSTDLDSALLSKKGGGGGGGGTATPVFTWIIPSDGTLSLRGDGLYANEYKDGTCGVSTALHTGSGSGDATIGMAQASGGKKGCGRKITIDYGNVASGPSTESFRTFANVRGLHNDMLAIPAGASATRTFAINPGTYSNNPSRCGRILFGAGEAGGGVGSDPLLVERSDDGKTWHITSRLAPDNKALCEQTGEILHLTVSFSIVSSVALP